jgi:hypothetical protein
LLTSVIAGIGGIAIYSVGARQRADVVYIASLPASFDIQRPALEIEDQ